MSSGHALEGEVLAAMQRLHGPEYDEVTTRVMQPLADLARKLEQDLVQEETVARKEFSRLMNSMVASPVLAGLLPAVSVS